MCELWKYGRPGDPIPGSRYVRAYCPDCGDPMRVSREVWEDEDAIPCCLECDPSREPTDSTVGALMQREARVPASPSPSWDNAVRCLEENR